jgi:DNA-binding NarL/FixJ family response regulator
MKPRIFVVDDHEIVREGIRTLLAKSNQDWEVCGEAANANDALEAVKTLKPDVIILDITMPGTSGLVAAQRIRQLHPSARVLMFTMHESDRLAIEVREVGAQGYVLKSQAARDLVLAIQYLLADGTFFGAPPNESPLGDEEPNHGIVLFKGLAWPNALLPRYV